MYYFWSFTLLFLGVMFMLSALMIENSILFYWTLWSCASAEIQLNHLLDSLAVLFSGVVLFLSGSVLLFSFSYMAESTGKIKFLTLMLAFVASMLFFIFCSNFMVMLLGWDGLGLISYLLVVFYSSKKAVKCGFITIMTNRIGDFSLIMGIAFMICEGELSMLIMNIWNTPSAYGGLIMIACLTKSAQAPFSAWLPQAMAAPTPVSSLVHSSTLVTAGVYLLYRNLMVVGPSYVTQLIGVTTSLIAGFSAIFEKDIKKIIALSTLSQMGFMFYGLGLDLSGMVMFHLLSHAFFKCMLFLSAGMLMHSGGFQDINSMPLNMNNSILGSIFFTTGSLSLIGAPFLSGFYSKDIILEKSASNDSLSSLIMLTMVFLTTAYSTKLILSLLLSKNSSTSAKIEMNMYNSALSLLVIDTGAVSFSGTMGWCFSLESKLPSVNPTMKMTPLTVVFLGAVFTYSVKLKSNLKGFHLAALDKLSLLLGETLHFNVLPTSLNLDLTLTKLITSSPQKWVIMKSAPTPLMTLNWKPLSMTLLWLSLFFNMG